MRSTYFLLLAALAAGLALAACGDDSTPTDGGGDTSPPMDTGTADSTPPGDTSPPGDSSMGDTSPPMDTGMPPACAAPVLPSLSAEEVATGFSSPVYVTQAPGSTDTLWVVERGGRIRLVRGGSIVGDFLDVSDRIVAGGEQGLLGLAFHPDYETNGRFFIYYTSNSGGRNVVAEYAVSGDPDVADDSEVARLMDIADPQSNHNGGMITFGPDGYLYVGTGDGGGGCDTHGTPGNGQSLDTLLGKLLRLDVENSGGDYVASGNPFEGGGGMPQIWAYGLRNPWRFSFDRLTDEIYIGDVGQNAFEEIDVQPATSTGGENYGWRFFEAYERSSMTASGCNDTGWDTITQVEPVVAIPHDSATEPLRGACSVTGGYVYRGSAIPELQGVYIYGDYCSDDIAAFRYCDGAVMGHQRVGDLRGTGGGLSSFGEDNAGELYMTFVGSNEVYKIIPGT
jgi:glucose/arabinose dehydrogenase